MGVSERAVVEEVAAGLPAVVVIASAHVQLQPFTDRNLILPEKCVDSVREVHDAGQRKIGNGWLGLGEGCQANGRDGIENTASRGGVREIVEILILVTGEQRVPHTEEIDAAHHIRLIQHRCAVVLKIEGRAVNLILGQVERDGFSNEVLVRGSTQKEPVAKFPGVTQV